MDSSEEEEDVFSCGRCKREFYQIDEFMVHKKSKECKKQGSATPKTTTPAKTPTKRKPPKPKAAKRTPVRKKRKAATTREVPGASTVEVIASADDGIPSDLFEDTQPASEGSDLVVIAGQDLSDESTDVPVCQFCKESFDSLDAILRHYSDKHNIPQEMAPINLGSLSSDQGMSSQGSTQSPVSRNKRVKASPRESPKAPTMQSPRGSQVEKGILMKGLGLSGKISPSPKAKGKPVRVNKFMCDICGISFPSQARLKTHLRSKNHKAEVTALQNGAKPDSRSKLHQEKEPELPVDGGPSGEEDTVDVDTVPLKVVGEERAPTDETRLKTRKVCAVCKEKFANQEELLEHIKVCHPSLRGKRTRRTPLKFRSNPGNNRENVDNNDSESDEAVSSQDDGGDEIEEPKDCPHCGKAQPTLKAYALHVRRCQNRQKYRCVLCQHQSRERYEFNIHMDHHKVWVDVNTGLPDGQENTDHVTEDSNLDDVRRESLFGEQLEGTTLSEVDLAALGLMPRSKLERDKMNHDTSRKEQEDQDTCGGGNSSDSGQEDMSEGADEKRQPLGQQRKCYPCKKWFHRTKLPDHMLKYHNKKRVFQCRDVKCLRVYDALDEFVEHIGTHSLGPMFYCGCGSCRKNNPDATEAGYATAIKKLRMKHYYRRLVFKCLKCCSRFPSQECLDKHMQTDTHYYPCEVCGKVQGSKNMYRQHMFQHTDNHKYLCEHCGKSFKAPRDLATHASTHTDERPFVCPTCNKGFALQAKLDRHVSTVHATFKPHVCPEPGCGKAFARKDKLRDHQYTHGTAPYTCAYCTKGFYRKDNLQDHLIFHTRQYKYKCKECNRGFMRPFSLQQHIKSRHGEGGRRKKAPKPVTQDMSQNVNMIQASREHDYTGFTTIDQQQVPKKAPLPLTGKHAFTTMLSAIQRGNDMVANATNPPPTVNTFIQVHPMGQPGVHQVAQQASHPAQNSAAIAAANSRQYRLTQSKLEHVKRQIEVVTQQLSVQQQFGGNFFQARNSNVR